MERLMFDTKTTRRECEMAPYDDDHVRLGQIAKVPRSLTSTLRHRQGASSSALSIPGGYLLDHQPIYAARAVG